MKGKSKATIIVRNRRIMLILLIVFSIILGFAFFTNKADAESSREVYTYYTSYEIQPGDTLWSIADQFMGPDYTNKEDFIANIKAQNHLLSDDITAGKYLVIKYSSYEELQLRYYSRDMCDEDGQCSFNNHIVLTNFVYYYLQLHSLSEIKNKSFVCIGNVLDATSCRFRTCAAVLAAHAYTKQNSYFISLSSLQ